MPVINISSLLGSFFLFVFLCLEAEFAWSIPVENLYVAEVLVVGENDGKQSAACPGGDDAVSAAKKPATSWGTEVSWALPPGACQGCASLAAEKDRGGLGSLSKNASSLCGIGGRRRVRLAGSRYVDESASFADSMEPQISNHVSRRVTFRTPATSGLGPTRITRP